MPSPDELHDFLKAAQGRAYKRAVYAVRDEEAALDIVQDAMIRLVESYADRPAAEWPLIFQRIVSNATMDWFRRQKTRSAVMVNFSEFENQSPDEEGFDLLEFLDDLNDSSSPSAQDEAHRRQIMVAIEESVQNLPQRQREAFLLRYVEELDVSETAEVMGCSEGSVKTHCSRAVQSLSKALVIRGISL